MDAFTLGTVARHGYKVYIFLLIKRGVVATWQRRFAIIQRVVVGRETGLEETTSTGAAHYFFDQVAELAQTLGHLLELIELRVPEVVQRISAALLDLAKTHVRDAIAHFSDIQQRRP